MDSWIVFTADWVKLLGLEPGFPVQLGEVKHVRVNRTTGGISYIRNITIAEVYTRMLRIALNINCWVTIDSGAVFGSLPKVTTRELVPREEG